MVRQIIGIEEPICQNPQIHYLSIWSIFLRFSIIMTVLGVLMWPNGIVDGKKCTKFRFHHLDFSKICYKYEKPKKLKMHFFKLKIVKVVKLKIFYRKMVKKCQKMISFLISIHRQLLRNRKLAWKTQLHIAIWFHTRKKFLPPPIPVKVVK